MVESIITDSREGVTCQKVNGTVEARESFEVSGRGGEDSIKFIQGFKGGRDGWVYSLCSGNMMASNKREVGGG